MTSDHARQPNWRLYSSERLIGLALASGQRIRLQLRGPERSEGFVRLNTELGRDYSWRRSHLDFDQI